MPPVDLQTLHAKIGQLALENDFFSGALGKAGLLRRKKKIDRAHPALLSRLPVRHGRKHAPVCNT
jgi:L,D-peptidoglycan transpeptidase YkuD (ErfK/YbiS/YcfS/YnhG family)